MLHSGECHHGSMPQNAPRYQRYNTQIHYGSVPPPRQRPRLPLICVAAKYRASGGRGSAADTSKINNDEYNK